MTNAFGQCNPRVETLPLQQPNKKQEKASYLYLLVLKTPANSLSNHCQFTLNDILKRTVFSCARSGRNCSQMSQRHRSSPGPEHSRALWSDGWKTGILFLRRLLGELSLWRDSFPPDNEKKQRPKKWTEKVKSSPTLDIRIQSRAPGVKCDEGRGGGGGGGEWGGKGWGRVEVRDGGSGWEGREKNFFLFPLQFLPPPTATPRRLHAFGAELDTSIRSRREFWLFRLSFPHLFSIIGCGLPVTGHWPEAKFISFRSSSFPGFHACVTVFSRTKAFFLQLSLPVIYSPAVHSQTTLDISVCLFVHRSGRFLIDFDFFFCTSSRNPGCPGRGQSGHCRFKVVSLSGQCRVTVVVPQSTVLSSRRKPSSSEPKPINRARGSKKAKTHPQKQKFLLPRRPQ